MAAQMEMKVSPPSTPAGKRDESCILNLTRPIS